MNTICAICEQLQKINSYTPLQTNTIWSFNPYLYLSLNQMRSAFYFFFQQEYKSSTFYTTYNEEGYTYTQWHIYYLAKNTVKSKKLQKQTFWLFQVLSHYPFFTEMIIMGSQNDPLHHTLLHFMRYLEKYGTIQKKIVKLLEEFSLQLSDTDTNGCSGEYFLLYKIMDKHDIDKCNQLTREYKLMESELFSQPDIKEHLQCCKLCNEPIDKFIDLVRLSTLEKYNIIITTIIEKRTECNQIYKNYHSDIDASVERHQYVIDIYKKCLSL
jgi:hypothetical protein